jgi:thiol-disulfide isomerase/thioredoxin
VIRAGLALFLAAAGAFAQAPAAPPPPELEKDFAASVKSFMEEYRAADEKSRPALLADPVREPRHRFTPLFLAEAERRKGTPAAIPYWTWLVENGTIVDAKIGEGAVARLLADHIADPELGPGARAIGRSVGIRGSERTIADLSRIVESSPHAAVRAEALFQRGVVSRQAGSPQARRDLERAVAEAPDSAAGKRAAARLAESSPLAAGDRAPELAGRTLAGEPMTIAALHGKVLLIDFWGIWCGPCVAQIPTLKKLHAQFKGKPFQLVGVNSDKDRESLSRFLTANRVEWTNVLDGGTDGATAKAWRVDSWPANFLVDGSGLIRARDVAPEKLDAEIRSLLEKR